MLSGGGGYGTIETSSSFAGTREGPRNPGTLLFSEADLHEPPSSVVEQLRASVRVLRGVKLLLLLLAPPTIILAGTRAPLAEASDTMQTLLCLLALLGTMPSEVCLVECLEDLLVRRECAAGGVLMTLLVEHAPLLLIAVWGLLLDPDGALCWLRPLLLGGVLVHLLVVLGASMITAPVATARPAGGSFGTALWTAAGPALVLSTGMLLLPTLYGATIASPDAMGPRARAAHRLRLSRGLAVWMGGLYALHTARLCRSRGSYGTSAGPPSMPSSWSYAVQYDATGALGPRFSRRFAAGGAALALATQATLLYLVVRCLPAARRCTRLPWPFALVILLPLLLEGAGVAAGVAFSRAERPDLSVGMALGSVTHLQLGVIPGVVLLAWALGVPLELSFDPFLAGCWVVAVLVVGQLITMHRVRGLEGAILLVLYGLIAGVGLVGGWRLCGTEKGGHPGSSGGNR